jgi:carbonic anhydrase/acetyltransferase-like protein (isoleucine patch superfamily)
MVHANPAGQLPVIDPSAYVHPSAVVIGNVEIGENVFVGPNAVIRSDEPGRTGESEVIVIEPEVNIQDCVVIHATGGSRVRVGKGTSLAHGAVVHGPCDVGERCFVGFRSVVFKASLGSRVVVQHQSLVEGVDIPSGSHVPSMTSVMNEKDVLALGPASEELKDFADQVRKTNIYLASASRM